MIAPAVRRQLMEAIEAQRLGCELAGSPLSASVLEAVADDVGRGGPFSLLLSDVADAPMGDAVLLRLLAGIHGLVLAGAVPELAVHYPSVGGCPGPGLGDALGQAALAHGPELADRLRMGVQTNEVGRSAALLGGFLEAGRDGLPLRILELGSSAGLNLAFDRYRYVGASGAFGPESSPMVFDHPWFAREPRLRHHLPVADRRGCDVVPIDPSTAAGRDRLRSFVWADQLDRLARLDAAIAAVGSRPPPVDQAPAGDWLERQLGAPAMDRTTVVVHTIVLQYLDREERRRVLDLIEGAGRSASADAPLCWLRLEPGGDQAELRLTRWPGGVTQVLARSGYHGPPVVWLHDEPTS